jgi:hypothetical protein
MAIHCRFKNPEDWEAYKLHIRDGRIFVPIGRSYPTFCRQTLVARGAGVAFERVPVRERTVLDDLHTVIPRAP